MNIGSMEFEINNKSLNIETVMNKSEKKIEKQSEHTAEKKNEENKQENKQENEINPKQLEQTLKKLNKNADIIKRGLKFEKVDEVDKWVVKVYNTDTGETIRQIPSEESLQIAKGIQEILGTIFDEKV